MTALPGLRRRALAFVACLAVAAPLSIVTLVASTAPVSAAYGTSSSSFTGLSCTSDSATSGWGKVVAPANAIKAVFTVTGGGAAGGDTNGGTGGAGGSGAILTNVTTSFPANDGTVLWGKIGCGGTDSASVKADGYRDGGTALSAGSGGGGAATGVCLGTAATTDCGTGAQAIAIAAGGGGGSRAVSGGSCSNHDGAAGGDGNAGSVSTAAESGGSGKGGGRGGTDSAGDPVSNGGAGGGGIGQSPGQNATSTGNNAGGVGGTSTGSNAVSGATGSAGGATGNGGNGGVGQNTTNGGAGGGGYTGGGGGAGGMDDCSVHWAAGGGGGAGSSWVHSTVSSVTYTAAPATATCGAGAVVGTSAGFGATGGVRGCHGNISAVTWTLDNPPTGASQTTATATKGTALTGIALANADADSDARTCSVVTPPTKGSVTLSGASPSTNCTASYTADPNTGGNDTFTYKVTDAVGGLSTSYTVTVPIGNRTPAATAQLVSTDAGLATPITLAGTDPDDDTLTCAAPVSTSPAKGSLSGSACEQMYTSSPGAANDGVGGTDAFGFTVSDAFGGTSPTTDVTVSISNPDLSLTTSHVGRFNPGIGAGAYTLEIANSATATANGTTTIVDTLPAGMRFRSSTAGSSGFTCAGTPGVSTTVTCTRSSQIAKSSTGSLTITVDVDEDAGSPVDNSAVISSPYELSSTAADNTAVDATTVNHRPTAEAHSVGIDIDVPTIISLGATDPDGDPLTYAIVAGPTNGSLSGSGSTRQYTPDTGFEGGDAFTYRVVDDGSLQSNTATIRIYVGVAGLTGTVTSDQGGAALAGIEARLIDDADPGAADPATLATALTDSTGAYDLSAEFPSGGVPYGHYVIRFVDPANSYLPEYASDAATRAAATDIAPSGADPVVTVDAALTPAGRIQGTVRSSAGAEPAIGGIQVRLVEVGTNGSRSSTTTAGGGYRFDLLVADDYQLWFRDVSSGQWESEWYDDQPTQATAATISMAAGQQRTIDDQLDPVVPVPPPTVGTISGTVRASTAGHAPIAGIQVRLYRDPYTSSAATTTDASGQYSFPDRQVGDYKLWFRVMSGTAFVSEYHADQPSLAAADVVTLGAGGAVVDAELSPPAIPPPTTAVIRGTVRQQDGLTPLAGIQVRLYRNGVATGSIATTTDGNGSYAFTGRAGGDYQLFFRDLGRTYVSEWYEDEPDQAAADPITAPVDATTTIDASLARK